MPWSLAAAGKNAPVTAQLKKDVAGIVPANPQEAAMLATAWAHIQQCLGYLDANAGVRVSTNCCYAAGKTPDCNCYMTVEVIPGFIG